MPIVLTCTSCEKGLRVADKLAGKKVKCPQCETVLDVPAAEIEAEGELALAIPAQEAQHANAHAVPHVPAPAPAAEVDELELMRPGEYGKAPGAPAGPGGSANPSSTETKRCLNCDHEVPVDFQFCVHCGYDFKNGRMRGGSKLGTHSSGWTPDKIVKAVLTGVLIIAGFYGLYYTYTNLMKDDKPATASSASGDITADKDRKEGEKKEEKKTEPTPVKPDEPVKITGSKPIPPPSATEDPWIGKWKTLIPNGPGLPFTTLIFSIKPDGTAEQFLELKTKGKEMKGHMELTYTVEGDLLTQTFVSGTMNGEPHKPNTDKPVKFRFKFKDSKMIFMMLNQPGEMAFERL